jgi:hypothetical protein
MGDKGTQQFIPGVAPSAPLIIKPGGGQRHAMAGNTLENAPSERKQTSKRAAAAKKKKRKNAKKSRKNNR